MPVAFVYLAARIVDPGVRWAVAVRVLLSVFTVAPLLIYVYHRSPGQPCGRYVSTPQMSQWLG
jgi:hypothetical protein